MASCIRGIFNIMKTRPPLKSMYPSDGSLQASGTNQHGGGVSLTLHESPRALAASPFNLRPSWLDRAGNLPLASLGLGALIVLGLLCYLAGSL
jgi:hypothetical protein